MKIPQTFYTIRSCKNENYLSSDKIRAKIIYFATLYNGTEIIWDKQYKSKRRAIAKAKLISKGNLVRKTAPFGTFTVFEDEYPFLRHFKYFDI
tara:strand:+ start:131 stop:409 length:279 start_codon:yes stop_codon:yes gene_type:complete